MSQSFGNSTPDPAMAATTDARQRSVRVSSRVRPMEPATEAEEALPVPIVSFPRVEDEPASYGQVAAGELRESEAHLTSRPSTSHAASPHVLRERKSNPALRSTSDQAGMTPATQRTRLFPAPPQITPTSETRPTAVPVPVTTPGTTRPEKHDALPAEYGLPEDLNDYAANPNVVPSTGVRVPVESTPTMQEPASIEDVADAVWLKRQKLIYEVLFQITLTAILITLLLIVHAWMTGKLFAPPPTTPLEAAPQVDGQLIDPVSASDGSQPKLSTTTTPAPTPSLTPSPSASAMAHTHEPTSLGRQTPNGETEFSVRQVDHQQLLMPPMPRPTTIEPQPGRFPND